MLLHESHSLPTATPLTIGGHFSSLVTRILNRYGEITPWYAELLQRAVLRQLDSAMLIEDSLIPFAEPSQQANAIPLPPSPHLASIERTLDAIEAEGLAPHLLALVSGFGAMLLAIRGDPAQAQQVRDWVGAGLTGAFFMTDRGGPSMQKNWLTTYTPSAEGGQLVLNKMWGISAMECGFAYVAARQAGSLSPVLLLLPPEVCAGFRRQKVGLPYLEGTVQLGNVSGTYTLPAGCALANKSGMGVKQFLTLIRPRFVRALCLHVLWLGRQQRIRLDIHHLDGFAHLATAARTVCTAHRFTRQSEDEVMALKFASNELLLSLVESGAVASLADQRDLLGFTKMEGSSYRCLYEIYERNRGGRRG